MHVYKDPNKEQPLEISLGRERRRGSGCEAVNNKINIHEKEQEINEIFLHN